MVTGIHILLTYSCTSQCDHCFVYGSPDAAGTFTLRQLRIVLEEAARLGTVEWIYFEGGEPFLFYPLLIEGVKISRHCGFQTGIVTNSYFAISEEDAALWIKPLADLGITDFSVSEDLYHFEDESVNPAQRAAAAARKLGLPVYSLTIEQPEVNLTQNTETGKGEPITGGPVMFRGRAVEKLTEGLPKRPWKEFSECPYEELLEPDRVHVDAFGWIQVCQGLCIGNTWRTPLSEILKTYNGYDHPICGPLIKGGPALLSETYQSPREEEYIDACHFCYLTRLSLLDQFPEHLAPRQVYGLE